MTLIPTGVDKVHKEGITLAAELGTNLKCELGSPGTYGKEAASGFYLQLRKIDFTVCSKQFSFVIRYRH